jgi:uncharacterized protein (DUF934 family)
MSEPLDSVIDAPVAQPTLIDANGVRDDIWQRFVPDDDTPLPPATGHWLVPLPVWLAHTDTLRQRAEPVGLWLASDDDLSGPDGGGLLGALDGLALIAVHFPAYTDGRGFTAGHLLRTRLGWHGELRAVGDVLIDTIHYLARCGFNAYAVKPGHDPHAALQALHAFTTHYQRVYPAPEVAAP